MARFRSSAEAPAVLAFLSKVRSAERWARLRIAAAFDFLRCLAADAILGKERLQLVRKSVSNSSREA